jgi:hypothetical protein
MLTSNKAALTTIVILGGLILILIGIIIEGAIAGGYSTSASAETTRHFTSTVGRVATEFLKTLGVVAVVSAGINLYIETGHWHSWFEDRLKSILLTTEYMEKLSPITLEILFDRMFTAVFPEADLAREGSFFSHFKNNIFKNIGGPFREEGNWSIIATPKDTKFWLVDETVKYICRKNGESGLIQERICWAADEANTVEKVTVTLRRPMIDGGFDTSVLISSESDAECFAKLKEGVKLSATDREIDKLEVIIVSQYTQLKHRYAAVAVNMPTKKFIMKIFYPSGFSAIFDQFIASDQNFEKTKLSDCLEITYNGWLLPDDGVVWQLVAD